MNIDGELSLEEALKYAAMRGQMPAQFVLPVVDVLYDEVRRLQNARDAHLFAEQPR